MRLGSLVALMLACVFPLAASANVMFIGNAVPLSDLENGGSLTVGDKVFSDFKYLKTGDMPDAANINVQGIQDVNGHLGIRFQGAFLDLPDNAASDALIHFNVSVAPGFAALISDAHLQANLDVVADGLALITETFLPTINNASLTVFNNGTLAQLTDSIVFDTPVASLPVQKDILLLSAKGSGVASVVSFIDQTFSQVPEPAGATLTCFLFGALLYRRWRLAE